MSAFVQGRGAIYLNGYDLTGQVTKVNLDIECDMKEKTSYDSSGSREYAPGIVSGKLSVEGFVNSSVDSDYFNRLLNQGTNVCSVFISQPTYLAASFTTGSPLDYAVKFDDTKLTLGGEIGEIQTFSLEGEIDSLPVRGTMTAPFYLPTTGARSAQYNATAEFGEGYNRVAIAANNLLVNSSSGDYYVYVYASCSSNFTAYSTLIAQQTTYGGSVYTTVDNLSTDRTWIRTLCYSSNSQLNTIVTVGFIK